jgi:hypothetical protein
MKNLRNLKLQALALFFAFAAVSCEEKDKDKNPSPDNSKQTEYNGSKYTIKKGFYQDGGPMDLVGDDDSHYNQNFFLTDGNVTLKEDGNFENPGDAKILFMAGLLSPGTTGFKTGTYEYSNIFQDETLLSESAFDAKYRNRNVMLLSFIIADTDGDKNFEEEDPQNVTGGTIKVSGTKPNYTLEYDLTLEGNKKLKGQYTGNYQQVTD